jgi:hypothetical protein
MKLIVQRILILACLTPASLFACDICGCGVGNNYVGILPDFQKHIMGIRTRLSSMKTHIGVGGMNTYLTTQENYLTTEAWGGWNIHPRFRIMATVPYNHIEKTNQGITQRKNGIGDVTVTGFYQLLNKRRTTKNSKILIQSLWIGAGAKLATGQYNPSDKNTQSPSVNLFQLGTGTYDITLNAMYDLRLQDMGVNINAGYKINTANRYAFRYGNKYNLNVQGYHKFRLRDQWNLSPNAGIQYERSATDRDQNIDVTSSGGKVLFGTIGLESMLGRIALGLNWQTPLSQDMARGIVKVNNRMMFHVAVGF